MSNIVEIIESNPNLVAMSKSVRACGLSILLSDKGPFTIFSPTALAFGKLQFGRLTELLKPENKAKLSELLSCHITEGMVYTYEFKNDQKLIAINGFELFVKVAGNKITINGASLQGKDGIASNGIIHLIDTVLEQ